MAITVTWAKYLQELPDYQSIVTDEKYLATWTNYLKKNESNIPTNELIVIPNNIRINNQ